MEANMDDFKFLVNPTKHEQPLDEWIATVWSICAENVFIDRSAGIDPMKAKSYYPVVLSYRQKRLNVLLNTKSLTLKGSRLATIVNKKIFSSPTAAWSAPKNGFSFEVPISISKIERHGSSVPYISATFIITSRSSGRAFWFLVSIFDPRGGAGARSSEWEAKNTDRVACSPTGSTKLPFAGTILVPQSKFIEVSPGSSPYKSSEFGERLFSFHVGIPEMESIIRSLNDTDGSCKTSEFSNQLTDYSLQQAAVMLEIHIGDREPIQPDPGQWSELNVSIGEPQIKFVE